MIETPTSLKMFFFVFSLNCMRHKKKQAGRLYGYFSNKLMPALKTVSTFQYYTDDNLIPITRRFEQLQPNRDQLES